MQNIGGILMTPVTHPENCCWAIGARLRHGSWGSRSPPVLELVRTCLQMEEFPQHVMCRTVGGESALHAVWGWQPALFCGCDTTKFRELK